MHSKAFFYTALIFVVLQFVLSTFSCFGQESKPVSNDRFYVLGEVVNPGDFELKPDTTVKSAIETAGGLTPRADKSRAVLLSGDEKISIDLQDVLAGSKSSMILKSGDTLLVKPGVFNIEGKVKNPGAYDIKADLTVIEALKMAGGAIDGADPEAAYIMRGDKSMSVDLTSVLKSSQPITIQVGDTLTVPARTVNVTGEVATPGRQALVPGKADTLQDALKSAGGPTKKGNLKKVQVTLQQDGKPVTKTVDATQSSSPDNNPVLHNGDSVYVPQTGQKKRVGADQVYQAIMLIGALLGIL